MSRYIWAGWNKGGVNLLTIPDSNSRPQQWRNELLASARGEINYVLMTPTLSAEACNALEQLRQQIEQEMRKRLNVKESPDEFKARCLFHASKINYRTGDRRAA